MNVFPRALAIGMAVTLVIGATGSSFSAHAGDCDGFTAGKEGAMGVLMGSAIGGFLGIGGGIKLMRMANPKAPGLPLLAIPVLFGGMGLSSGMALGYLGARKEDRRCGYNQSQLQSSSASSSVRKKVPSTPARVSSSLVSNVGVRGM